MNFIETISLDHKGCGLKVEELEKLFFNLNYPYFWNIPRVLMQHDLTRFLHEFLNITTY